MKKIFYTMGMAAAILFTSCTEDKGTSTEVADANKDERINPAHLMQYPMPGTAASSTASLSENTNQNAEAGITTAETKMTAEEMVRNYYVKNDPTLYYKRSSTSKMAGMTSDKGTTTKTGEFTGTATATDQDDEEGGNQTTNMRPGSTTADAQSGRKESTTNKSKTTTDKKSTTTSKKKERLTPYEDKKQR
ncbi:hypothetical protein H8S95_15845 [Pontibacter sp. KCTC 32443]|uniref:hypothetical protein n=1 Tax=Pontibacter TaxID=323449 RepID=UPI00164E98C3|nr:MULTISPECIES: hypothetical protein [Pontibacter]MBC5775550.1 hypothetical protein [Pontibacter sp. KCTC 32443]